jgi:hypothetical protein
VPDQLHRVPHRMHQPGPVHGTNGGLTVSLCDLAVFRKCLRSPHSIEAFLTPSPPAHGAASSQDALVSGGYLAAGYSSIHIDDCWMETSPPRNAQGQLQVRQGPNDAPVTPGFSYQLSMQRVEAAVDPL